MLTSYYRIFKFLKPTMFARVIWPSSSWENWNSCNICKSLDTLATITVMKNKVLCLWHRRLMSSPSIHKTVSVLWQSNLLPCKLSKNIRPFAVLERCFGSEDGMLIETRISGRGRMKATQPNRIYGKSMEIGNKHVDQIVWSTRK